MMRSAFAKTNARIVVLGDVIVDLLFGLPSLGALGAVFRAALLAIFDASGVQRAAHDVITDARQIFYAAAANQHDGVFL